MSNSVTYSTEKAIPAPAVQRLLRQTDWARDRPAAAIATMLDGSLCVGAWQGDRLVGFGRAITDHIFRAFIEDVVIDETWRGQGIGSGLMRVLLDRLDAIEEIYLFCDDPLVDYYVRLGFEPIHHHALHIWKGA